METRHTVLIIDDHALFRRGMVQVIDMDTDFLVIGDAASGPAGL